MKEKQPLLCYTCHLETKQQFNRTFHHRVNEGLVQCSDCHNPHGGFLNRQLRATASQDAVCFKCHTEKAGPFVYEHPPVKIEGCASCHIPHGSSNPRYCRSAEQVKLPAWSAIPSTSMQARRPRPRLPVAPGAETSSLHAVPRGHPRIKL